MSNGFVYVASLYEEYYKAAVRSAISLKDNFPEANITLFTHELFLKDKDRCYFDNIVTNIPVHKRAKMWGMARTPYDNTFYLDSDTEIRSDSIKNVFDIIKDHDIMFTRILSHVSKDDSVDNNNKLEYHGGVVLYNNRPLTKQLIEQWYQLFCEQHAIVDWESSRFKQYNSHMRYWDQFTIWYLLRESEFKEIRHGFFPKGGHEYNYIHLLEEDRESNKPYKDLEQIVYHYTIPQAKVNASHIKNQSRAFGDFN